MAAVSVQTRPITDPLPMIPVSTPLGPPSSLAISSSSWIFHFSLSHSLKWEWEFLSIPTNSNNTPTHLSSSYFFFFFFRSLMAATRYWVVSLPVQSSASSSWNRLRESISKQSFDTPVYRVIDPTPTHCIEKSDFMGFWSDSMEFFLLFPVQHARSARRNSWFSSLSQRRSREGKSFVDRIEFLWFLGCFENAMISWRYDLVSVIFSPFWNRNDLLKTRSDAISVICYRFWDRDDWSLEVAIFGIWTEILMFSSILWWIFWNWVEVY